MAKQTTSKYTAAHEATIRAQPVLNKEVAAELAAEFGTGFTARSVIAKINRMGLAYDKVAKTTKAGTAIEQKEAIVAQIAELTELNLEGLEKAPKPALQALRNFLAA